MAQRILIVDDDPDYLAVMERKIASTGFGEVAAEVDPKRAVTRIAAGEAFDLVLIDMAMPEMDGLSLLEMLTQISPATQCIMVTAVNEARVAVDCLNRGAFDYLIKPVAAEQLRLAIHRALEHKRLLDLLDIRDTRSWIQLKNEAPFAPIVTRSNALMRVLREAELHADSNVAVLITGESGTGKELLARAIHDASRRADRPFTAVNMASVTGSLFEAEFFGHARGAFTGAERQRAGFLEVTHGGTLFLDEIGNMPVSLQGKLLRFLQDGEYFRLGASERRMADIRVVAATNEDLEKLMARGRFRKDLFYRIRGGCLHLPALRDRREDIPLLVRHFLKRTDADAPPPAVDQQAMCLLMEYQYPGNVRELMAIIQSAANLAQGGPIRPVHLPAAVLKPTAARACAAPADAQALSLAEAEKIHILRVYAQTGNNKSKSARLLGIGLNTLRRKLRAYGIH